MTRFVATGLLPVCLALALVACNGDEEKPTPTATLAPSPSPVLTPTASAAPSPGPSDIPESGGQEGFRRFAEQIAATVDANDAPVSAAFFADRGLEVEEVCAGDELLGFCEGKPAGTVFRGIPGGTAQTDDYHLSSRAELTTALAEWFSSARPFGEDDFGSGAITLYAIAYRPRDEFSEEAYQAILTGFFDDSDPPGRQARVLSFRFVEGRWRLAGDLFAGLLFTAEPYLKGDCCPDFWERWEE